MRLFCSRIGFAALLFLIVPLSGRAQIEVAPTTSEDFRIALRQAVAEQRKDSTSIFFRAASAAFILDVPPGRIEYDPRTTTLRWMCPLEPGVTPAEVEAARKGLQTFVAGAAMDARLISGKLLDSGAFKVEVLPEEPPPPPEPIPPRRSPEPPPPPPPAPPRVRLAPPSYPERPYGPGSYVYPSPTFPIRNAFSPGSDRDWGTGYLRVLLPSGATLYANGVLLPNAPRYQTPPLQGGRIYYYNLEAQLLTASGPFRLTYRVSVEAGVESTVDFVALQATAPGLP